MPDPNEELLELKDKIETLLIGVDTIIGLLENQPRTFSEPSPKKSVEERLTELERNTSFLLSNPTT